MGTLTQFSRPELVELINRISNDMSTRMAGRSGAVLRRSALDIVARAEAGAVYMLHGHLDWIANQIIIDTATGEWLERWAAIWKIVRKAATYASGTATLVGVNGYELTEGAVVVRGDGFEYSVDDTVEISGGTATVSLTALLPDTADVSGNIDAGTVLTLQEPADGINNAVTVSGTGIGGGAATESDEELRSRLLFRIQNPPRGGSLADYVAWAREVAGVTRAWSFAHHTGIGKVGITFVLDNEDDIVPDAGKLAEVEACIETVRPATVKELVVFAPALQTIDLTIKIENNDADTKAAVIAEIEAHFSRWKNPGDTVFQSQVEEAISVAAGEVRHEITASTPAFSSREIVLDFNELPKLGTVTWQSYS